MQQGKLAQGLQTSSWESKLPPQKSLKSAWSQIFFSINKLCGCQHLDKVATFPKKKGKQKIREIQASPHKKIGNMGERNAFFFFSYPLVLKLPGIQTSLELDFLCSFCSQGLCCQASGTHGRAEKPGQVLALIVTWKRVEGDFTLRWQR